MPFIRKSVLFILASWPSLYLIGVLIYFAMAFSDPMFMRTHSSPLSWTDLLNLGVFCLTSLIVLVQTAYYFWHMTQNPRFTSVNKRFVWLMSLFLFNPFMFLPYWFFHILSEPPRQKPGRT